MTTMKGTNNINSHNLTWHYWNGIIASRNFFFRFSCLPDGRSRQDMSFHVIYHSLGWLFMDGCSLIILHLAASQIDGNKIACLTCLTTNYVSQPMCLLVVPFNSYSFNLLCCCDVSPVQFDLIPKYYAIDKLNYNCFV